MPPRNAFRRMNAASVPSVTTTLVTSETAQESFWQAVVDTEVFNAPMGSVVAGVTQGTVVKESARFVDPFNDMWIATKDGEGQAVWFREKEELSLDGTEDERDMDWIPVVPADQEGVATPKGSSLKAADRFILDKCVGHDDIPLYEHFWASVYEAGDHRDWNSEYQLATEQILFTQQPSETETLDTAREALQTIIQEFASHVENGVTAILSEMFSAKKADRNDGVVKHPTARGVYYLNGALFQIAIDATGAFGGDEAAIKVASQSAKCIQACTHIAPRYLLSVPMTLSMGFGGYRVTASSIPPVGMRAARVVVTDDSLAGELVRGMAAELNLKVLNFAGSLGLSQSFTVVAGQDCRLYLAGLHDLMPPIAPPTRRVGYKSTTTARYWRLRREAVEQSAAPVSAAAFLKNCSTAADDEVATHATNWVRCVGLQTCAAVLGLMEPCSVNGLEGIVCTGCSKEVEDELRFGVCSQGCCHICAQCNIHAYECLSTDTKKCEDMLSSYVKCSSSALGIRSLRLVPDVSSILHHYGVNLRFLHAVYSLIPPSAKSIVGHFLEVEMVARAAKTVLNRRLRRSTTSLEDIGTISAKFFMALMQPGGEMAEQFWAQELGPAIQELFDVFVPFDTEALDITRVCQRVSELTGVMLTAESIASFAKLQAESDSDDEDSDGSVNEGGKPAAHVPTPPRKRKPSVTAANGKKRASGSSAAPAASEEVTETAHDAIGDRAFIQISAINPTMKDVTVPIFCREVGGRYDYLSERLSPLLLLWAGLMDGCKEQFMLFEASHPRYLNENAK